MLKIWRYSYLLVLLLFISGVLFIANRPSLATIDNRVNGGLVSFRIDRQYVLHPWSCVTASWTVDGIENVFFDDRPTIGEASEPFCPATSNFANPTLYVDFRGNFIQTYTIPVTVIVTTRPFLFGAVALLAIGLILALARSNPEAKTTPANGISRRSFLTLAGVASGFVLVVGGVRQITRSRAKSTVYQGWVIREDEVLRK